MKEIKNEIFIQEAQVPDAVFLAELQAKMAWETEEHKLDAEMVEMGILAVLSDPKRGTYYKITQGDQIIGCLLTTYEWSEWRNAFILWIQSLYLLPDHRGKGIYRAVYQFLQEKVRLSDDLKGIRLYVDKSNQKAIKVYQALGMDNQHYEMFEWLE